MSSLFVVDAPENVDVTTAYSGTMTEFMRPPQGTVVRRLTNTTAGESCEARTTELALPTSQPRLTAPAGFRHQFARIRPEYRPSHAAGAGIVPREGRQCRRSLASLRQFHCCDQ